MTLDEAKELYMKYNCSLYQMFREEQDKYILYKELNITEEIEQYWKNEYIQHIYLLIKRTGDGMYFNQLYELASSFCDKERLSVLISALEYIDYSDDGMALCVAETIIGRKKVSVRSGMIFWAWKIGEFDMVLELIEKVQIIITYEMSPKQQGRKARIIRKVEEIRREISEYTNANK